MPTELEALYAMLRGDDESAERLIRSLHGPERRDLKRALSRLTEINDRVRREDLETPPSIRDPRTWTS